jgi:uncharacterized protein YkwD
MHKAIKYLMVLLLAGIVAFAPASAVASGVDGDSGDAALQDSLAADQGSTEAVVEDSGVSDPAADEQSVNVGSEPVVVPPESPDVATAPEAATYTNDQTGPSRAVNDSGNCDSMLNDQNNAANDDTINCSTSGSNCGKARLVISYNKCGLAGDCGASDCQGVDSDTANNSCAKADNSCTKASNSASCNASSCNTGSCQGLSNAKASDSASCGESTCTTKDCTGTCSSGNCDSGSCSGDKDVAAASQDEKNCTGNLAELVNAEELYSLIFAALTNAGDTYTGPNSDLIAATQNYLWRYFQSQNLSLANTDLLTTTADQAGTASQAAADNAAEGYATDDEYAAEVIRLVNIERVNAGLAELAVDQSLCEAAAIRSSEIQGKFSHTRPDGSSCFTALSEVGASYTSAGENIASGQGTPQEVVEAWMNSPGHRANILNASFSRIGVASLANNGGSFSGYAWAQFFAN